MADKDIFFDLREAPYDYATIQVIDKDGNRVSRPEENNTLLLKDGDTVFAKSEGEYYQGEDFDPERGDTGAYGFEYHVLEASDKDVTEKCQALIVIDQEDIDWHVANKDFTKMADTLKQAGLYEAFYEFAGGEDSVWHQMEEIEQGKRVLYPMEYFHGELSTKDHVILNKDKQIPDQSERISVPEYEDDLSSSRSTYLKDGDIVLSVTSHSGMYEYSAERVENGAINTIAEVSGYWDRYIESEQSFTRMFEQLEANGISKEFLDFVGRDSNFVSTLNLEEDYEIEKQMEQDQVFRKVGQALNQCNRERRPAFDEEELER